MPSQIRRTEYFYTTVKDEPGDAYKLLSLLAEVGVNLLAFTAVPIGPLHTQLTLFPADPPKLTHAAKDAGFVLDGPHLAFIVSGDDELGAPRRHPLRALPGERQRLFVHRRHGRTRQLRVRHLREGVRLRAGSGRAGRLIGRGQATGMKVVPG